MLCPRDSLPSALALFLVCLPNALQTTRRHIHTLRHQTKLRCNSARSELIAPDRLLTLPEDGMFLP